MNSELGTRNSELGTAIGCAEESTASGDNTFTIPSSSPNFQTQLAAQLAELIPEAVADGKLDIEKLRELLADDVADSSERFGLFWPGKKRALRAAQAPTTATLKPDLANAQDWDATQNVFIEGDNLEVLKILQRHYHNKIKLIYIDPPYNTGKDFVYPDNYKEGLDTYLEWTRQVNEAGGKVSSNAETAGRYHSNWLNMMYPRLKLARNLLTDDGVIFISIDDNEQDNLKKLCNEIFGESNFLGLFVVNASPSGIDYGHIARTHDYALFYAKNVSLTATNQIPDESKEFKFNDENGGFNIYPLYNGNVAFNPKTRPNLYYPFYLNPKNNIADDFYEISVQQRDGWIEVWPVVSAKEGIPRVWRWGKTKASEGINKEIIGYKNESGEYRVVQKSRHTTKVIRSLLLDNEMSSRRGTRDFESLFNGKHFNFPKAVELVKSFVTVGASEDDIILDFFAGSSTTAHAVMQLNAEDSGNRRFIMVQLPEPTPEDSEARKAGFKTIADISRKRIQLAGEKIKAASPLTTQQLDTGFRAYKLTDTHFAKWRISSDIAPDKLEQRLLDLRDSADDEATPDELLTEILLKLGFPLTAPIADTTIAGLPAKQVGSDQQLLAYLDEHTKPTLEQLRELVNAQPARLVVLEDAFQGDDGLKTNLSQYAKSKGVELWTA